jgi:hypothetical protein
MAATVGPTVLAAAGMAMWGLLADLGLVKHGDELVVGVDGIAPWHVGGVERDE